MHKYQNAYKNCLKEVNRQYKVTSDETKLINIGKKMAAIRQFRNLTQKELAELLELSRSAIKNFEIEGLSRQKLNVKFLDKLAAALSDDEYFIVDGNDFLDMSF